MVGSFFSTFSNSLLHVKIKSKPAFQSNEAIPGWYGDSSTELTGTFLGHMSLSMVHSGWCFTSVTPREVLLEGPLFVTETIQENQQI